MKINYVEGDLFAHLPTGNTPIYIPHIVNNIGRFGSGFAKAAMVKYPEVRDQYIGWHEVGLWGSHGMTAKDVIEVALKILNGSTV